MIWGAIVLAFGAGYAIGGLVALRETESEHQDGINAAIDEAYNTGRERGRLEGKRHE